MRLSRHIFSILAALASLPVMSQTWTPMAQGFSVLTPQGRLAVQAYSNSIIRVRCIPIRAKQAASLAVVGGPTRTNTSVRTEGHAIILRTNQIAAHVDPNSGNVWFSDLHNHALLKETSRVVRPDLPLKADSYRLQQSFALSPNEGIYGLGQHFTGRLNNFGQVIRLQQKNMDVAVPMMLSNRGYGILWDNPSVTEVAIGATAGAIPSSNLIDTDGKSGALTVEYFDGNAFQKRVKTERDASINFDWGKGSPEGLPNDRFSIRFTGKIEPTTTGVYSFTTTSDDGVRLWVDGKLLVDHWDLHAATADTGRVSLQKGKPVSIKLEYFEEGFDAKLKLQWTEPTGQPTLKWSSEAGAGVDYYFLYGPKLEHVIQNYRALTGSAPMFGRWAYGYWQCKERYSSSQELLDVLGRYRKERIPIDNIIQDWYYWHPEPWGSHHFDPTRYPDPKALVDEIHRQNAHIIISVWAKFEPGSDNYDELDKKGFLYPVTEIKGFDKEARYYDAFSPEARELYWRQIKENLYVKGFDGWWLDATEPELTTNWGEFRAFDTALGKGATVYNAYPLMTTSAVYKGDRAESNAKRSFILTRSAYLGQQRNGAVTWSGDIGSDWETFRRQIPAGLNFCMSGIPYWNTDIGGFGSRDPSDPDYRECFTRWFQFGAFCPMFRVHGTSHPKEMWRFGPETEKTLVKYDRLRYRLMPYLYSVAWQVSHDGSTMMRALPLDFQDDQKAADVTDQFLFGPSIMVNPVTTAGVVKRSVYLPGKGSWTDFWTGIRYAGGKSVTMASPVSEMPILVRPGSIVPMGPEVQYASEKNDPVEIRIYPGANASFTLYEDEGDGYAYEHGVYTTITMHWDDRTGTLAIGKRQGAFPGMLQSRTFNIVQVRQGNGVGIDVQSRPDAAISYDGRAVARRLKGVE